MALKFAENDIAEVALLFKDDNYENCCVGYAKNGGIIEIAFDDLNINEEYALALLLINTKYNLLTKLCNRLF